MIKLIPIDKTNIRYYIKLAFEGDKELLEKYHILAPSTLEECVKHTAESIEENEEHYKDNIEFYAVILDVETVIGYTIIIKNKKVPNELYSFAINVKYRQRDILEEWLRELAKKLGDNYYTVLWQKNTRAIDFFEKNGFIVEREDKQLNDMMKTLIICQ